jgi:mannose-6-phosphate isomerase-like protein (cupin superfamily)
MRAFLAAALIGCTVLATGAMADDYLVVPKSEQKLKAGPGNYYRQQMLLNHKNAQANITIRDHDGQAEAHDGWEDHLFVLEGEADLILGGTVEKPTSPGPGETRGDGIKDGKRFALHPGDYIYVPVKVPHQMMVPAGKSVRYAVVKTKP